MPLEDNELKENLALLLKQSRQKKALSLGEILEIMGGKGRLLIVIFLTLPFCQPLQIPGLSTPFGIVIALIGLRIAFSKQAWLPKSVLAKKVKSETLEKLSEKFLKFMKKMRTIVHPRMSWMSQSRVMQILNGLLIVLLGLFLALPVPIPFSNIIAGWAIVLLSIGLLEEDGLFILLSYTLTIAAAVALVMLIKSLL